MLQHKVLPLPVNFGEQDVKRTLHICISVRIYLMMMMTMTKMRRFWKWQCNANEDQDEDVDEAEHADRVGHDNGTLVTASAVLSPVICVFRSSLSSSLWVPHRGCDCSSVVLALEVSMRIPCLSLEFQRILCRKP